MAVWRIVDDNEQEELQKLPSVSDVELYPDEVLLDVYWTTSGSVLVDQDGDQVHLEGRRPIKLLDEHVDEPWCYQAWEVEVTLAGSPSTLLPGTCLAVLNPELHADPS